MIEIRILGPLDVVEDGRPVVVGAPKVRALLAVLVLHRGEVVSTDRLIDALWGEEASPTAARTVQVYVSNLRKTLGDGLLVTEGRGYVLHLEPGRLDVDRFDALAARGRAVLEQGDALTAATVLREALAVWRGPPLADFAYESFAQAEIARLEEVRAVLLEDRIDADLASGEHARLVGELEGLVREYPLRERVRGQLMLALYRSGRQADALQAYRDTRRELLDGLGLEPGRALQELERAILAHDPALDPPGRPAARGSAATDHSRLRGGALIAAAGALLLAVIVVVAVKLARPGATSVRVAPNSVVEIDARSGRVVAAKSVGERPGPIAFGSGSLWIANLVDQTISRLDPSSLRTVANIPLRTPAMGLAASGGGVWVVEPSANPRQSSVSATRIDPEFNAPGATIQIGNVVPNAPGAVAARGGSVWIAPSNGLLTRLDAVTGVRQGQPVDPNASPAGVAVGSDGTVWLADSEANNVIRVDPSGLRTTIPVGNGPTAIAAGESGVWVIDSLDEAVDRIDPGTNSVTATIPVGRSPAGIAVGGGYVWVANSGDGTVTRIDPRTAKPISTTRVGGSPQALTVAGGRVWVTVDTRSIVPTNAGSGGGTLRMVSFFDVDHIDPALAFDALSLQLMYATCAGLVNYPDKAGAAGSQLIPEVAQALPTRSPDGRTYTFRIRSGFRFSPPSNQPVTAQTFKDSIERTLNPAMQSPFAYYLQEVVGARQYVAGKASHITGVVARGNQLTIRLRSPVGDFLSQIALSGFCAVPSNTPINRNLGPIPSAGPYYVKSYTPKQTVVLARNPNYHGTRPHRFARIELAIGIPAGRAAHQIEAGTADYMSIEQGSYQPTTATGALLSQLAARYGEAGPTAARGAQQFFVNPTLELDYLALNTHRSLFSDVRLRQAVNYAIDRHALATIATGFGPEPLADHYLPPGMPGYRAADVYPTRPDPAKARRLVQSAHAGGRAAVLYTPNDLPGREVAQIVKNDLSAIGIRVDIHAFPADILYSRLARPGEPFDLAYAQWTADHPDPSQMLNLLLDGTAGIPSFNDPTYQRRLAAVSQLSGPQRYLTYGALDLDLARNAAPLAAFGNNPNYDLFSARIGCQTYGLYGMDLAALCIRRHHSR